MFKDVSQKVWKIADDIGEKNITGNSKCRLEHICPHIRQVKCSNDLAD